MIVFVKEKEKEMTIDENVHVQGVVKNTIEIEIGIVGEINDDLEVNRMIEI